MSELGGSSWWSQALAQTNALDTEDYDSLIDKIDENSNKRYQLTAAVKVRKDRFLYIICFLKG